MPTARPADGCGLFDQKPDQFLRLPWPKDFSGSELPETYAVGHGIRLVPNRRVRRFARQAVLKPRWRESGSASDRLGGSCRLMQACSATCLEVAFAAYRAGYSSPEKRRLASNSFGPFQVILPARCAKAEMLPAGGIRISTSLQSVRTRFIFL